MIGQNNKLKTMVFLLFMISLGVYLSFYTSNSLLYYITGISIGYILARSSFGFMSAVRDPFKNGNTEMFRALLIMFFVTSLIMGAIHYSSIESGAVPSFISTSEDLIIPGTGSVDNIDFLKIIGALIFGVGMALGGGCASGILVNIGSGNLSGVIVLAFFGIGGIISQPIIYELNNRNLNPLLLDPVYFPEYFGVLGSILLTLILVFVLYYFAIKFENSNVIYKEKTVSVSVTESQQNLSKYTLKRVTNDFLYKKWSKPVGAILISILFAIVVITTQKSWGVSTAYNYLAFRVADKIGVIFKHPGFQNHLETSRKGLLHIGSVVRNFGSIIGVMAYFVSIKKFRLKNNIKNSKHLLQLIMGGLLMGLGARFGRGCNIGAVYAGIANFSLSGWISFILSMLSAVITYKFVVSKINN